MSSIAAEIGCTSETLRLWVNKAERESGARPGPTSEMLDKLEALERENHELRLIYPL